MDFNQASAEIGKCLHPGVLLPFNLIGHLLSRGRSDSALSLEPYLSQSVLAKSFDPPIAAEVPDNCEATCGRLTLLR